MKPITKAQELRNKQAKSQLQWSLSKELIDFKERYLKSFVEFKMNEIQKDINRYTEKYGENSDMAAHLIKKKSDVFSRHLEFLNEANEGYNIKFERLIDTLVGYGIMAYPLKIEKISGGTHFDFGFLISHSINVVHARFIFACGEINAPHYRFIITKRENK